LLSNEINNTEKIAVLVAECKRMGITILPPDVNRSGLKFIPEAVALSSDRGEGEENEEKPPPTKEAIRYGLAAIKHVGEGAMEVTIRERERGGDFRSLEDFCSRLDSRVANRKMLESLVKSGAFDFLNRERAELIACIDNALSASAAAQRDRAAGQVSLFGHPPDELPYSRRRMVTPWTNREKMTYEKELLGFYVTGHPLDAYAVAIAKGNYQTIASLSELSDRAGFRVAGAISQVDKKFTKKEGKPFAVIWIEDLTGTLELVVWNELYLECADNLVPGNVVAIRGKLDLRDESLRATAEKLRMLSTESATRPNDISSNPVLPLCLRFSREAGSEELREVREILSSSPGPTPVELVFESEAGESVRVNAGANFCVTLNAELQEKLAHWLSATLTEAIAAKGSEMP
jgi:DNA polymerase-3 subunit alpha